MEMTKGSRENRERGGRRAGWEWVRSECWYYSVGWNDRLVLDKCLLRAATYCALRASREGQRKREKDARGQATRRNDRRGEKRRGDRRQI